ncbi:helix-turn-helix domain-containing protein [Enterobacter ludwigii]|nr:helix-turn-helix domain-containing protein [Enterobacter ludwigii]
MMILEFLRYLLDIPVISKKTMDMKIGISMFDIAHFKPRKQIDSLIHHFLPMAIVKTYPSNRIIHLDSKGERLGLLLLEGQIDVSRKDNGLLRGTVKAPFLFGMSNPDYVGDEISIYSVTTVKVAILPYREAMNIIKTHELWEDYCGYLLYVIGVHHSLGYVSHGLNSTDVVKRCLRDLMNETEIYRKKTNACKYILEKTALSRSGVMAVLAKLKSQKLIVTERGILHSLSDNFN